MAGRVVRPGHGGVHGALPGLQPLAGAKVLGQLFGLPPWAGASLITAIILIYTLRGGLKAVAWTDVFQGLLMFGLMAVALIMVTMHYGGWSPAFDLARQIEPSLFSRPGPRGVYSPAVWFSFLTLWFFCDPMFPQLFQRFYSAKRERSLARTMACIPWCAPWSSPCPWPWACWDIWPFPV